jgi:hypothetical protein
MGQAHLDTTIPAQPTEPFSPRPKQGKPSPRLHQRLAGEIRPASSRWTTVEWPESKPVHCVVTDRFGVRREGRAHRSGGFHSGANWVVGSDGGGAEEQPRAPARRSRELPASVWSSGQCRQVRRGTGAAFRGSSTMAA